MDWVVRSRGSSVKKDLSVDCAMAGRDVGCVCVRMSLRRLEGRSASLSMLGGVSVFVSRSWCEVLIPPTGGSASVNIMSGVLCPSTTLRADVSASSLCVTLVCGLTLLMWVLYPLLSLVWMMSFASCKSC